MVTTKELTTILENMSDDEYNTLEIRVNTILKEFKEEHGIEITKEVKEGVWLSFISTLLVFKKIKEDLECKQ